MFEFGKSPRGSIGFDKELEHLTLTDELVGLIDRTFSRFPDHINYQSYGEITSATLELAVQGDRRLVMSSVYSDQQRLPAVAVGPKSHPTEIDFSLLGDEGLLKKHGHLTPGESSADGDIAQEATNSDLIDIEWLLADAQPRQN